MCELDEKFYYELYRDVKNEAHSTQHWNDIGKYERRIPNRKIFDSFDNHRVYIRDVKVDWYPANKHKWSKQHNIYWYKRSNIDETKFENMTISSVIDLAFYKDYDDYHDCVAKFTKRKHNPLKAAEVATKRGYFCSRFEKQNWVNDIYKINTSKSVRCGQPMRSNYLRNIKNPNITRMKRLATITNKKEYSIFFGVYINEPGYTQGKVITDKRLVGYINLSRLGSVATYNLIIGHGDYLKDNVMHLLHFYVMKEWVMNNDNQYNQGLRYIIYAGHYQGEDDKLRRWKEKKLFEPYMLHS
jgi:hypothetical protein